MHFIQSELPFYMNLKSKIFGLKVCKKCENSNDFEVNIFFEKQRIDFILICRICDTEYLKQIGYNEFVKT